ncbi:MAG: FAD-dependent thymidylate synthase [Candidatus Aminicenantes bacterium]|nr:MAG: FAD-dependent thymidylate synthase [Candidatus Aminicenantes bacterium]
MKVTLAGYNVDSVVIEELRRNSPPREDITPETLSASYARISRDPRPASELRAVARAEVEKARRSNENIIFKMGHHSVAEHAVFNFDIVGVSRLALEEIEKFRLCSYTEKSQRYIKLKDDFVVPDEIKKTGLKKIFVDTIKAQNTLYRKLYDRLKPYIFSKYKELSGHSRNHAMLDGWAKEDARYVVSLATEAQVGITLNARNLEFLIRRFASKKLIELRELNQKIYEMAKEVAPSIILFTEANDYDAKTYQELGKKAKVLLGPAGKKGDGNVCLVSYTPDGDNRLLAALLHSSSSLTYEDCEERARGFSDKEKESFLKLAWQHMEFYDFALREFEYLDLQFDLIVSATCFAQLKRHRMASITTQSYNPQLGVTIPPSVEVVDSKPEFLEMIKETNEVYDLLRQKMKVGAEYVLTNAHRKRVLFKVNVRELYHISRLREDLTAQWDIRQVVGEMVEQAKNVMPLACSLIGGKDAYPEIYKKIFGKPPRLSPPKI